MFLAQTEGHTGQFPTTILSKDGRGRYLELMTSNSVFSPLNQVYCGSLMQLSVSLTQDSNQETELAWSLALRELKERYNWVSSA